MPRGLMMRPMAEILATGEAAGRAVIGVSWIAMTGLNPPALEVDADLEFGCRGAAHLHRMALHRASRRPDWADWAMGRAAPAALHLGTAR